MQYTYSQHYIIDLLKRHQKICFSLYVVYVVGYVLCLRDSEKSYVAISAKTHVCSCQLV